MSQTEHSPELYCPGCGYDLRALMGDRCPECGIVVDLAAIGRSEIPWSHRARLGRVNAFVRTVWVASADWRLIARAAAQPVSFRDAQKFRWIVVLLAWLPLGISALVLRAIAPLDQINFSPLAFDYTNPLPRSFDLLVCLAAGYVLWPIPPIALLLFVAAATGLPSFFFHPRDLPIARQNRALALSYYTCAPLTLLFVPTLLLWICGIIGATDLWRRTVWFQVFALLLLSAGFALIPVLLYWWRVIRLLSGATHCSTTRIVATAILLPLLWLLMAGLCLLLFPGLAGLVHMMIDSIRS